MKTQQIVLFVAFATIGFISTVGCGSKPTCETAVANLRELAKKDPEFQKRIGDEKDEELIAECKKAEGKSAEAPKCVTEAKTADEANKCFK